MALLSALETMMALLSMLAFVENNFAIQDQLIKGNKEYN